ncbi:MAG: three-Cys-motif partner protein TcmP [Helicobacteraceae bacterium]|nr:three-Cys-motif partner protein TcmP [Helicobacteraceae bacterium]
MSSKRDAKKSFLIHSEAKVEFYKQYLSRYLIILLQTRFVKQINIYDVFCGTGIYDDGGKGSPIVAFEIIKDVVSKYTADVKVSLIVNDKEKEKIERVKAYLEIIKEDYCDIVYYNTDIDEMFKIVKDSVLKSPSNARNLIFIDPYGYKNIRKEIIDDLTSNKKTKIILFLPISHMYRFSETAILVEGSQYKPLLDFINDFIPDDKKLEIASGGVMGYIQIIADALKHEKRFAASYYIERDAANKFALFFMTSNILGFEKILEVKWKLDDEAGRGFNKPKEPNLFSEIDAENNRIVSLDKLERLLNDVLKETRTNIDIYRFTIINEFLPKHTNEIFTKWQKNNPRFKIYGCERKNAFYISHEYYKNKDVKIKYRIVNENNEN